MRNIVNAQKTMKRWKLKRQKGGSLFRASFPFLSSLLLIGRREDALKCRGDYLGSAIYNSWKCYFSQEIILNGLQIASF